MNIADAAPPGGDVEFLLGVVEIFSGYGDAAKVRFAQPGDAIEQRGFSCAGCAEQNCESSERAEVDVEVEAAFGTRKALADADFEVGGDRFKRRRGDRRRNNDLYRQGPTAHERRLTT